jgi:hypothetical protein
VIVPVPAGEGAFGTLLARYGKFFRREFLLPFSIGLDDFIHLDSLPSFSIIPEEDEFHPRASAILPGTGQRVFATIPNGHEAGERQGHEQERAPRCSI